MRRTASEVIRELEMRVARLEGRRASSHRIIESFKRFMVHYKAKDMRKAEHELIEGRNMAIDLVGDFYKAFDAMVLKVFGQKQFIKYSPQDTSVVGFYDRLELLMENKVDLTLQERKFEAELGVIIDKIVDAQSKIESIG